MPHRRLIALAVSVIAVGSACRLDAQTRELTVPEIREAIDLAKLPMGSMDGIEDGTPPLAEDDRPTLLKILQHASGLLPDYLWQAYKTNLKIRRNELFENRNDPDKWVDLVADMRGHSDRHRGKVVTVRGFLRKLTVHEAGENDFGQEWLYRLDVAPLQHPNETVVVVCGEIPEDLPRGEGLNEPIRATGYFLKLAASDVSDEPRRLDPVIICPTIHWFRVLPDDDMLAVVEDETRFPRADETDAYLQLLSHARLVDGDSQKKAAREFQKQRLKKLKPNATARSLAKYTDPFVDIFKNPKEYRGKPVILKGYARRIVETPAGPNDYGIKTLHEIFLYTETSQTNPVIVICTEIPDALAKALRHQNAASLDEPVVGLSVVGYFFKLGTYADQRVDDVPGKISLRKEPVVIAHRLEWTPATPVEEFTIPPWFYGVVALVALGILRFVVTSRRKDREFQKARQTRSSEEPDLQGLEAGDPDDPFAGMDLSAVDDSGESESNDDEDGKKNIDEAPTPPADTE